MIRNYLANVLRAIFGQTIAPPAVVDVRAQQSAKLADMLHDSRFEFRTIGALSKAIGAPEQYTAELLRAIGARQAGGKPHLWGAVDVVGATVRGFSY